LGERLAERLLLLLLLLRGHDLLQDADLLELRRALLLVRLLGLEIASEPRRHHGGRIHQVTPGLFWLCILR
jgi:hypothetical protein